MEGNNSPSKIYTNYDAAIRESKKCNNAGMHHGRKSKLARVEREIKKAVRNQMLRSIY